MVLGLPCQEQYSSHYQSATEYSADHSQRQRLGSIIRADVFTGCKRVSDAKNHRRYDAGRRGDAALGKRNGILSARAAQPRLDIGVRPAPHRTGYARVKSRNPSSCFVRKKGFFFQQRHLSFSFLAKELCRVE